MCLTKANSFAVCRKSGRTQSGAHAKDDMKNGDMPRGMQRGDMQKYLTAKRRYSLRRTARLAIIAMFVALISVGAFIKFPIGIVPVSMQMAVCIFCALTLGPWESLAAVAIYIALGLLGVPIFTMGGGFSYVLQPTFGYLLGYIFALPVGGMIARGVRADAPIKFWRLLLGAFVAMAIVYTFGVTYMYLMLNYYVGSAIDVGKAWLTGCAVFLPTDTAWCVIGALVARRVAPIADRGRIASRGMRKELMQLIYVRQSADSDEFED